MKKPLDFHLFCAHIVFFVSLFFSNTSLSAMRDQSLFLKGLYSNKFIFLQKTHPLDHRESFHVVTFVSPDCPCSQSYLPYLTSLAQKYDKKGVAFHFILSEGVAKTQEAKDYFHTHPDPLNIIHDFKQSLLQQFDAYKTPHTYLLNKRGDVLYRGAVGNSHDKERADVFYLDDALKRVIKGQEVPIKVTSPLGCVIDRISS